MILQSVQISLPKIILCSQFISTGQLCSSYILHSSTVNKCKYTGYFYFTSRADIGLDRLLFFKKKRTCSNKVNSENSSPPPPYQMFFSNRKIWNPYLLMFESDSFSIVKPILGILHRHCGLLFVKHDCTFKMESIKLRTVRPFLLESVSLSSTGIHPQDNDRVESYLTGKVEDLIDRAKKDSDNDKLPLVRLKVSTYISIMPQGEYIHQCKCWE